MNKGTISRKLCVLALFLFQTGLFAEHIDSSSTTAETTSNAQCENRSLAATADPVLPKSIATTKVNERRGKKGHHGKRGHRGHRGKQGSQGIQGIPGTQGTQGIQGTQGVQGPSTPLGFIAPHDLFVDAATTQDPLTADGTLAKPYKTIQAAINSIPAATSATEFQLGTTIYIAGNLYPESPVINGDSKRIVLVAMGDVVLSSILTPTSITVNYTPANTNFGTNQFSSVTVESLTSLDYSATPITGSSIGSSPKFNLNSIIVNNASSSRVDLTVNAALQGTITSTLNPVSIFLYNSYIISPLTLLASNGHIVVAESTVFSGAVTATFVFCERCIFDGGLTIASSVTPNYSVNEGFGEGLGYVNCQINTALNGGDFNFWVDSFTNSWITGLDGAGNVVIAPTPVTAGIANMKIIGRTVFP